MTRVKPGSLKCVVLASPGDLPAVLPGLIDRIGDEDVMAFGASAILVHTEQNAAALRDWVEAYSALVVEFETWAGRGEDVPREWLLARGH